MTPAARLAAAIEILDVWLSEDVRAERLLRDWGRANRYAGSKDRRAIGDLVYDCIRRKRSLAWLSGASGGRGLVHGLAVAEGWDVAALFSDARYAPPALTEQEARPPSGEAPSPVAHDHPDWMEAPLRRALGNDYSDITAALTRRAPVDLRVNLIKSDLASAQTALAEDGIDTDSIDRLGSGLRAAPGARIASSGAYLEGLVELQDASSQRAAALANPAPGEVVLDYCAGGGGKALAFASITKNAARIIAHDAEPERLKQAAVRSERAGADIEVRTSGQLGGLEGQADLIFVDAPCSGSGSWRRDPEGKWRLTSKALLGFQAKQRHIFGAALNYLKANGRIAFATCSILEEETQEQVEFIQNSHAHLSLSKVYRAFPSNASDGFFCALFDFSI